MTPVEAVLASYPPLCPQCPTECGSRCVQCTSVARRIVAVVLAAADAEPGSGPWVPEPIDQHRWKARRRDDPSSAYAVIVRTEVEAVGVCGVLNRIEARRDP